MTTHTDSSNSYRNSPLADRNLTWFAVIVIVGLIAFGLYVYNYYYSDAAAVSDLTATESSIETNTQQEN